MPEEIGLFEALPRYRGNPPAPGKTERQKNSMLDAVVYLSEHLLLIVPRTRRQLSSHAQ
jgi:hypothetical protein